MTLREILNSINYKTTFNYLYKTYYKDKSYEDYKIMECDSSYRKVIEELKSLKFKKTKDNKDLKIYLVSVPEEEGDRVDVCFYHEIEDSIFSIDFYPWDELIDLEVQNGISANKEELAAHILWELTFWGFSSQEVQNQAKETLHASDLIEQPLAFLNI